MENQKRPELMRAFESDQAGLGNHSLSRRAGYVKALAPCCGRVSDQSRTADYALFVNGRLLGILRGEKGRRQPAECPGTGQTLLRRMSQNYWRLGPFESPFLYASNGEQIWFADMRDRSVLFAQIAEFPQRRCLEEPFARDYAASKAWFKGLPNEIGRLRTIRKRRLLRLNRA